jgi:predicted nucleotidyltransferase
MKNIGIIAEFNPFHNGHKHFLETIKKEHSPNCIIAIMSGNFVQRGDLAIIDKWRRAETAVRNGVNLVIELPVPFAIQNAEVFASGAISIFSKLDIQYLCFGTEADNINDIYDLSRILTNESISFKISMNNYLKKGLSYPKALSNSIGSNRYEKIFTPNNILAIEYIKSLIKNNYSIKPVNVKRIGSQYNSETLEKNFSSATAIRKELLKGTPESIRQNVPSHSYEMIIEFFEKYSSFNSLDNLYKTLQYKAISMDKNSLLNIYDIKEGIENKILSNITNHNNINDLILSIKSKRYTYSRVRRILLNILLNLNYDFYDALSLKDINNIKVLSFDSSGQKFLKQNKHNVTFITKKSDFKYNKASITDKKIYNLTDFSTKIYTLAINSNKTDEESFKNSIKV